MKLRQYQARSLDALKSYMRGVSQHGAKIAFIAQTDRAYRQIGQLPGLPYVCLRVPTGGGKTIMAAHAIGIAAREYLQADTAVCLWLVPSNAILDQTLKALRDREHPYHHALKSRFAGNVVVLDLTEALYVQRDTLTHDTCVIVCTLAALRVEDTDGRKVYEQNGVLQSHFTGLPPQLENELDKHEGGGVIASLANALRLHRPVVIVDEAHNARTGLSFDTLARFAPSCIIEFTATPQLTHKPEQGLFASNILHHVSAAELKAEDMVKLPIKLATHPEWKETLARAVAQQKELERLASLEERTTGEYLRPIVLVQAQPQSRERHTLTVEVVKRALLDDFAIPDEQIAIATGETREIDGVDLYRRDCALRFIITVQALKEGWDCPFAYVLCSVAEQHSARAVEQILGRVLRMPNATRKQTPELNCAYAFVASAAFATAVQSIKDALVENMGFQRIEADELVQAPQQMPIFDHGPLFAKVSQVVSHAPNLTQLDAATGRKIEYDTRSGSVTIHGHLSASELQAVYQCFDSATDRQAVATAVSTLGSGGEAGSAIAPVIQPLAVPVMAWRLQGELEWFDEAAFLEATWDLASCDADVEFDTGLNTGASGTVDVSDSGKVETSFTQGVQNQLALVGGESGWTIPKLALWLDNNIAHPDVLKSQSSLYMHRVITDLIESKNFALDQLVRRKFALARVVATRIDEHRAKSRTQAFQAFLFGGRQTEVEVSADLVFTFDADRYSPNWYYEGGTRFTKHFARLVGELKDGGEEWECAAYIEQHPAVEVWIRNLERRPESSFWLQTATDRFYPDFVARLTDGRILVVEYKGMHLWSNDDSKEKRAVGDLWAARSKGKCLFIMPNGPDFAAVAKTIEGKR
jgi:type III restriction enzyme